MTKILRLKRFDHIVGIIGIILSISCGQQDLTSETKAIIGDDQRSTLNNRIYESTVGSISFKGQAFCSAFITGTYQVTTAAHCILEGADLNELKFTTANGNIFDFNSLDEYNTDTDFAQLSLSKPSDEFLNLSDFNRDQSISIVGWDSHSNSFFKSSKQENNREVIQYRGFLMHSLDTLPSASGSPIIQNGKVVGMHLGYVENRDFNIALILNQRDFVTSIPNYSQEDAAAGAKVGKAIEIAKDFKEYVDDMVHDSAKIRHKSPARSRVEKQMRSKAPCKSCHGK